MHYYLAKDKKTKKVHLIEANSSEKAREALQGLIGFPNGIEWVIHENSPSKLMGRFGVHLTESYWADKFNQGNIQDVTKMMEI